jgi:uncharacterized protein YkwD
LISIRELVAERFPGGISVIARTGFAAALAACWIALTGAGAPDTLEQAVLDRINYVRAHPQEYAGELREYRSYFQGNLLFLPGDENGLITREGPEAVDEAIDFLEQQAPLPPLAPGDLLALAARDHAVEQGDTGATGHASPDGASPGERVRRRGGNIYVAEAIAYGNGDADTVVRGFIIDDGVPTRGHRNLLFAPRFHYAGVGCGAHARYDTICVIDYAGTANGDPVLPKGMKDASALLYRGVASR